MRKLAKTSQRFPAVSVFSLKPKFTAIFQKYTLIYAFIDSVKHCATVIDAYFGIHYDFNQ
jgi:hypothetical protein